MKTSYKESLRELSQLNQEARQHLSDLPVSSELVVFPERQTVGLAFLINDQPGGCSEDDIRNMSPDYRTLIKRLGIPVILRVAGEPLPEHLLSILRETKPTSLAGLITVNVHKGNEFDQDLCMQVGDALTLVNAKEGKTYDWYVLPNSARLRPITYETLDEQEDSYRS